MIGTLPLRTSLSPVNRARYVQEHDHMTSHTQSHPPSGFALGLAAGMFVGAGLAILLAPRLASHLRERITDSAKDIDQRASGHDEHTRQRFGEASDASTNARAL
jgi:hypothetical protein